MTEGPDGTRVARVHLTPEANRQASRYWWDIDADRYQAEHGVFLGDVDLLWGPEGLRESQAGLLGPVAGRRVLEVGCGAGQCARWLAARGAQVVGFDLSGAQLAHAAAMGQRSGLPVPLVRADAQALPFADASFDLACSAYGAVIFVADSAAVMREAARVLRPGGRWVFSVTHPLRWCFPDDAGPEGLTAVHSYFDRTPYVESDAADVPVYVEHHRTIGDRVREIVAAGLRIVDCIEPEWADGHVTTYTQWGELRGRLVPGTTIWVTERPA